MQLSHRFSIAVHILLCIAAFEKSHKVTSGFIAGSVGVNPVVIRQVLGMLKRAGLVEVRAGSGGASLLRNPARVSLRDVYLAVDLPDEAGLFNFHKQPNPACPVGRKIHPLLDGHLGDAQEAMEKSLSRVTLESLLSSLE